MANRSLNGGLALMAVGSTRNKTNEIIVWRKDRFPKPPLCALSRKGHRKAKYKTFTTYIANEDQNNSEIGISLVLCVFFVGIHDL